MYNSCSKHFSHYYLSRPVSFYIDIPVLSLKYGPQSPNGYGLYALRVLPCTIPAHLMTGTQFNGLSRVKCIARGINLYGEQVTVIIVML